MKTALCLCLAVLSSACAAQRDGRQAADVYVARWTHLSAHDQEQIVRVVGRATRQPIQAIGRCYPGSDQISVFTGFSEPNVNTELHSWWEFKVERVASDWRIVSRGKISEGMVHILLSYPPNDTRDRKSLTEAIQLTASKPAIC